MTCMLEDCSEICAWYRLLSCCRNWVVIWIKRLSITVTEGICHCCDRPHLIRTRESSSPMLALVYSGEVWCSQSRATCYIC